MLVVKHENCYVELMLPQKHRLNTQDFKKLKFFKKSAVSGKLSLRLKVGNPSETIKLGFVVSNKISKKAIYRNSLKRRLRSIASESIAEIKSGSSIAVFVKEPYKTPLDFNEIKSDLIRGFVKLGLLDDQNNNR